MPRDVVDPSSPRCAFAEHGLVVFRNVVPEESLARIQETVRRVVRQRYERYVPEGRAAGADAMLIELDSASPKHESFVYDVLRFLPETYHLSNSAPVLGAVRSAMGLPADSVLNVNNVNFRVDLPGADWPENLPWHQDWPYRNPLYVRGGSVASWIAVFDCPIEVGPVVFKKGSHYWQELEPIELDRGKGRTSTFTIPEAYRNDASRPDLQIGLSAGDLVVFDLMTVHRSGINRSGDRVRWSVQGRYHDTAHEDYLSDYDPEQVALRAGARSS